jgi:hypothetical protein
MTKVLYLPRGRVSIVRDELEGGDIVPSGKHLEMSDSLGIYPFSGQRLSAITKGFAPTATRVQDSQYGHPGKTTVANYFRASSQ